MKRIEGKDINWIFRCPIKYDAIELFKLRVKIDGETEKIDRESLCNKIEHEIEAVFGIPVKVILRTSTELGQIILNCPFSKDEVIEAETLFEVESLYVALLKHNPLKENIKQT